MYKKVSKTEIEILSKQGCSAAQWDDIEVSDRFNPSLIENCRFEGVVRIGENVTLRNIHQCISNYVIEDNATVSNVDSLVTKGISSFGNGTLVSVLNETGGREVPIYENISSQIAYITAMYRHRAKTIEAVVELIKSFSQNKKSELGIVGNGAKVTNCGDITNVKIGENAIVNGASELSDGTVAAESHIGRGVIMRNFITASSSKVTDGAIIEKCFVGQGCEIGKGFSAENSLFFANCVCMNGEACSVFAGPYTVTHHKSSLLIGGMFSFYNAGSGTNQSNHYYRLGAVHQGILERGCKTASSSYILFPAHIGAFSIVKGRHNKNIDTSSLPFSYIIENDGESLIIPGANLTNAGAARDAIKWETRDNRKGSKLLDDINFKMFTPYTVSKIIDAINILQNISAKEGEYISYGNAKIKASSVAKALNLYNAAIDKYIGSVLADKLEQGKLETDEIYHEKWADIGGMIAPLDEINEVLDRIDAKNISSIAELSEAIDKIAKNYEKYEWGFVINLLTKKLNKPANTLTTKDLITILTNWKISTATINELIINDAKKEFSDDMTISYGIDGDTKADFKSVRGSFEDNSFIKSIAEQTAKTSTIADKLINKLND